MKFKIQSSKFKIIVISLLTLHFALLTAPVYAADSTPSASIQNQLAELKKEIASRAAALKKLVNQKLQNKAYAGKLTTKSDTGLTIATKNGPKIVNINQDTVFASQVKTAKGRKTAAPTLKSLNQDDYLAALGDVDETGVLTAREIILLPIPEATLKTYLWGQVVSISDQLATIKDKDLKTVAVSLPDGATVKTNNFVILTGTVNKNRIFEAEFVHVIPQGAILLPKKPATPSAKVASPTAKVSPTKKQ